MDNSNYDMVQGVTLTCAIFTAAKASHQTWVIYWRNKRLSIYIAMVWAEWITSFALGVVSWMYLKGAVMPTSVLAVADGPCIVSIALADTSTQLFALLFYGYVVLANT